jgi:CRP/FNR family cyclic AMP-dependent transcriptional regulator
VSASSFFDYESRPRDTDERAGQFFLRAMDADDWTRVLSVAQHRAVRPGEVVIRQGESSRAFYIVAEGTLEVLTTDLAGGEQQLHRIDPMSIFGEQAFFDGLPRAATVRAITDGELFGITPDGFEVLSARHPDLTRVALLDLGRILSLRLREMTELALKRG